MDETGALHEPPDMDADAPRPLRGQHLRRRDPRDDQRRLAAARDAARAARRGRLGRSANASSRTRAAPADALAVSVETAHPAKFPEEIQALLGVDPPLPPSLAGLEAKPEHYGHLTTDYEPFRDLLKERYPEPLSLPSAGAWPAPKVHACPSSSLSEPTGPRPSWRARSPASPTT